MARDLEGGSSQYESQEGRGEGALNWEESSLAKFSQFLGFSTVGLVKEILSFLVKTGKRREKIHSKGLLEKSKFERELKRLECSVNYGGKVERNVFFRVEGVSKWLSNEPQAVELECEGSERQSEKESN